MMQVMKQILCPVDLSGNSLEVIELATLLARQSNAKLVFLYVEPQWLPEETMFGAEYQRPDIEFDRKHLQELRPTDPDIPFEHRFLEGNPGPTIVKVAQEFDLVVMSSHGRSGWMRLLMGSVAQYVLRHAPCGVVQYRRAVGAMRSETEPEPKAHPRKFVTESMRQVAPIHGFDKMDEVASSLAKSHESSAPVVDEMGYCIGILTQEDIDGYRELKLRLDQRDESVVDEIFETDEFGQRRAGNCTFDHVHRHMTSPAITISNNATCQAARELFDAHTNIHHLVVVDENRRPVGVFELQDLGNCSPAQSQA